MKCEKCGIEGYIMDRSSVLFENDTTAEEKTRAYYIFSYGCINPKCENHGTHKVIGEKKVYLD